MKTLKYKVIKTKTQYNHYCKKLENLLEKETGKGVHDEIDLLTLLIEKRDSEHNTFEEVDPICLLTSLMDEHGMKPKDLVDLLGINKAYVSEILHYKKGLSKEVIRKLSDYFKVSQQAFNRPYKLKVTENFRFKNASVMNTRKKLIHA
ncbi:MAG: transcriptional regulator [Chitinophagaceae bacterium]